MSFTPVFGGEVLAPSNQSYSAVDFDEDLTLTWALESQDGTGAPVASHMDLTPDAAGLSVFLPRGDQGSNGFAILFTNSGSDSFTVKDQSGNTVVVVASGLSWYVYLQDNSTANGVWATFQFGAGTSAANAASLAGAGLKAIGLTLNQMVTVSAKNANYAVVDGDRAKLLNWIGGNGAFTLPDPTTLGSDWFILVRNSGSGSLTITPAAGTIDAGASLLVTVGDSCILVTDGANYYTIGFGQSSNSTFDYLALDIAGTGAKTLAGAELNRISYNLYGALTGNREVIVPATVQQYWIQNNTTNAFTVEVKTAAGTGVIVPQGSSAILFSDGTNVVNAADTASVAFPITLAQGGTNAATAADARVNLGLEIGVDIPANDGTGATGEWGIDISGQAASALSVPLSGCLSRTSGSASIASGTPTAIVFDAADAYDTGTIHDPGSNPSRFVVPAGKSYMRLNFLGIGTIDLASQIWLFQLYKNGAAGTVYDEWVTSGAASTATGFGSAILQISTPWVPVTAADYWEVFAIQSNTGGVAKDLISARCGVEFR